MEYLYDIKSRLCKELEPYAGKQITKSDLEIIHMLTRTIKNIDKILMSCEEGDSHAYAMGNQYTRRMSRDEGMSREYSGARYSRAVRDHLLDDIERMLDDGTLSVNEKEALTKARHVLNR